MKLTEKDLVIIAVVKFIITIASTAVPVFGTALQDAADPFVKFSLHSCSSLNLTASVPGAVPTDFSTDCYHLPYNPFYTNSRIPFDCDTRVYNNYIEYQQAGVPLSGVNSYRGKCGGQCTGFINPFKNSTPTIASAAIMGYVSAAFVVVLAASVISSQNFLKLYLLRAISNKGILIDAKVDEDILFYFSGKKDCRDYFASALRSVYAFWVFFCFSNCTLYDESLLQE
jgi:hypothetical protein